MIEGFDSELICKFFRRRKKKRLFNLKPFRHIYNIIKVGTGFEYEKLIGVSLMFPVCSYVRSYKSCVCIKNYIFQV